MLYVCTENFYYKHVNYIVHFNVILKYEAAELWIKITTSNTK